MNTKPFLALITFFALSAFAADDTSDPVLEKLRTHIRAFDMYDGGGSYPYGTRYGMFRFVCEENNIPMSTYHTEILAAAEVSSADRMILVGILCLMGESGSKEFLPFIENSAAKSTFSNVRTTSVEMHLMLCGFDSFPFVKQMMLAEPDNEEGYFARYRMAGEFFKAFEKWTPSEEQVKEICRFLLEQAATEKYAYTLARYDLFLVKHLTDYECSRQRLAFAHRQGLEYSPKPAGLPPDGIKAAFLENPPQELNDMRKHFPDLDLPLEELKDKYGTLLHLQPEAPEPKDLTPKQKASEDKHAPDLSPPLEETSEKSTPFLSIGLAALTVLALVVTTLRAVRKKGDIS